MITPPVDNLELRALEERNRLHQTATELRRKIAAVREKVDPVNNAREHFMGAAAVVSVIGLAVGYSFAGIFTRH